MNSDSRPTSTLATEETPREEARRWPTTCTASRPRAWSASPCSSRLTRPLRPVPVSPTGKWRPCLYGAEMIEGLRTSQYKNYMERIQKSDCKAEMKRLMERGPPVWVTDKHACPLEEGETHVCKLWFMSDNQSLGMLEGACCSAASSLVRARGVQTNASKGEAAAAPA